MRESINVPEKGERHSARLFFTLEGANTRENLIMLESQEIWKLSSSCREASCRKVSWWDPIEIQKILDFLFETKWSRCSFSTVIQGFNPAINIGIIFLTDLDLTLANTSKPFKGRSLTPVLSTVSSVFSVYFSFPLLSVKKINNKTSTKLWKGVHGWEPVCWWCFGFLVSWRLGFLVSWFSILGLLVLKILGFLFFCFLVFWFLVFRFLGFLVSHFFGKFLKNLLDGSSVVVGTRLFGHFQNCGFPEIL